MSLTTLNLSHIPAIAGIGYLAVNYAKSVAFTSTHRSMELSEKILEIVLKTIGALFEVSVFAAVRPDKSLIRGSLLICGSLLTAQTLKDGASLSANEVKNFFRSAAGNFVGASALSVVTAKFLPKILAKF